MRLHVVCNDTLIRILIMGLANGGSQLFWRYCPNATIEIIVYQTNDIVKRVWFYACSEWVRGHVHSIVELSACKRPIDEF